MSTDHFEPAIGLEIHAQLKTRSKIFSSDSTAFEAGDNENIHPVSVGMPGTLPVLNRRVVELSVLTGLALKCQIRRKSVFARKNYFYPDLPKGYQISQHDQPLCEKGEVVFEHLGKIQKVSITRAHMEEDAGKSTHFGDVTLINYNRSGVPLLEIVSGPDMKTPAQAAEYARTIRQLLQYLDVCDGNLEEGSLRCDCNVSVRPRGQHELGTKVEIKNINSFRFVEKAIEYEIQRQVDTLERGEKIVQETRLWDPDKNRTVSMRAKEDALDYRYFSDPDLLPVCITDQFIDSLRNKLPELPRERKLRFESEYQLSDYDSTALTSEKPLADYFEKVVEKCQEPKLASNWILSELLRELNLKQISIEQSPLSSEKLAELIQLISSGKISGKIAKTVFQEMWISQKSPDAVIREKNLVQVSDDKSIEAWVNEVILSNPVQVADYQQGREKIFGFFVGAVMKLSRGQANPDRVNDILKKKLKGGT